MSALLAQAMEAHAGSGQALSVFWREVKDLPGSLPHEYWLAIRREGAAMSTLVRTGGIQVDERQPGIWGAALLAGLPHLLMGLLIWLERLGLFDLSEVSQTGSLIIGPGPSFAGDAYADLRLAARLAAVERKLVPVWNLGIPYGHRPGHRNPQPGGVLALYKRIIHRLDPALCRWRFCHCFRSRLHGLLSVASLFPMLSLTLLEFIPNPIEAWLALGVGLAAALVAGAIVRIGELRLALGLVLGFSFVAGLVWAYIGEWRMLDLPAGIPAHIPKFSHFLGMLALYAVFGLGVIALPFVLRGLWSFGRRRWRS